MSAGHPQMTPGRRAAATAAVASFLLHALGLLMVWLTWGSFGRRNVLTWIDFPVSLLFLDRSPGTMLAWSLVAGGMQWAAIGAILALLVGRSARPRGNRGRG